VPQTDSCTAANSDATRSPHRHGQGALIDIRGGAGENSAQCLILARTRAKHCNESSFSLGDQTGAILLRVPQTLKLAIEKSAAVAGVSTNTWLMRCAERAIASEREQKANP
jgi:hypothetical protein